MKLGDVIIAIIVVTIISIEFYQSLVLPNILITTLNIRDELVICESHYLALEPLMVQCPKSVLGSSMDTWSLRVQSC